MSSSATAGRTSGGFTSLLLPAWFEPYGPLLMTREWPQGVALRFAGTKKIYGSEIQSQLQQFKVIATHILKISSL